MEACSNTRKTKAEIGEERSMMKAAPATADDPSSKQQQERKAEVSAEGEKAAGVSAEGDGCFGLVRAENGMWIMPDEEVQFILNFDRDKVPPGLLEVYLQRKAWLLCQFNANKGVVYLDDEMAAERAEHRRVAEEVFADMLDGIDLSEFADDWKFSDRDSDFYNSDDEEDDLGGDEAEAFDQGGDEAEAVDQGEYEVVGQATIEAN